MEDNYLIPKTAIEVVHMQKERLYCMFVELQKAYDKILRSNLLHILLNELGILESNPEILMCMYSKIKASVLVESKYA